MSKIYFYSNNNKYPLDNGNKNCQSALDSVVNEALLKPLKENNNDNNNGNFRKFFSLRQCHSYWIITY